MLLRTDPANDWAPSEDVLRITVTSGPSGRTRAVKVTFTLSAAPDPAATYRADLDTGQCDKVWSFAASGLGTSNQTARYGCCSARRATRLPRRVRPRRPRWP